MRTRGRSLRGVGIAAGLAFLLAAVLSFDATGGLMQLFAHPLPQPATATAPHPSPPPTPPLTPPPPTPPPTSPTPTPPPQPAFLPLARHGAQAMHADIVLLIDLSESMAGQRLEATKLAVHAFLDATNPRHDQVAIVGFHRTARVVQHLTSDRDALYDAVAALQPDRGSRFDRAMSTARNTLLDPDREHRNWHNRGVVIMFAAGRHDGLANDAIAEAFFTGNSGFAIFTVAIGPDADVGLLAAMADTDAIYVAAEATGIHAALQSIADRLLW